jgi:hypothetical protein
LAISAASSARIEKYLDLFISCDNLDIIISPQIAKISFCVVFDRYVADFGALAICSSKIVLLLYIAKNLRIS